ncbi:MAG: 50S ribosomal protein L18 [Candidatus Pacebacteria bacterium]|nr:50S ribosomal protein L18 [Candidatus Paceibacterota bacterium]
MKTDKKTVSRKARQRRVRAKVSGTATKPRLAIFRSNVALSAQLIDDAAGNTLATVTTANLKGKTLGEKVVTAGTELAKLAHSKKVSKVVFDRGGYAYIGNVKAFADAVREGGIKF